MTVRTDTRRMILEKAQTLLQQKGYNGFSYKDISTPLGIKNAAVHYHFPSKDDLGSEVVKRERRRFQKIRNLKAVKEMDPSARLDWFFSIYTNYMDNGRKVCIPGSLAPQFDSISADLRAEAEGLFEDMFGWLADLLEEGRQSGDFNYEGQPRAKAASFMAGIQGAMQLVRITGDPHLEIMVDQLKASL